MKMAPFGAIPVDFQVDRHTEGFRDEPLNCAGYSVRSPSAALAPHLAFQTDLPLIGLFCKYVVLYSTEYLPRGFPVHGPLPAVIAPQRPIESTGQGGTRFLKQASCLTMRKCLLAPRLLRQTAPVV